MENNAVNMINNRPGNKHASPSGGKQRTILIAVALVAAIGLAALCVWNFWLKGYLAASNAAPAYVSSVASITGAGLDTNPRYSGLVEPQKITKINKDDTRTVAEVLVKEGDQVEVGTPLFRYDTDEIQLSIRQVELDLEGISNQLTSLQDQKKTLEDEKKKASSDDQYSYTVSIQSVELNIKEQEYNKAVKQSELEKLKASLENNEITSEAEGVIQQINLTPQTDSTGQALPFISILSSGEYRVKGTITEQNIQTIYEGQPVTIRSRVDSHTVWQGTIDSISYEPAQDNTNNMYYGGMEQGEQSSKYNFYVILSELEGLILGQHVYIEPDRGQTTAREGLWLPAAYVVTEDSAASNLSIFTESSSAASTQSELGGQEDAAADAGAKSPAATGSNAYVWARNQEGKLERRAVLLGGYDQGEELYEIVSGLELTDYIALPRDTLVEGGPTTTDASAQAGLDGETDLEGAGPDGSAGLFDPSAGEGLVDSADGALDDLEDDMVIPETEEDGSTESGESGAPEESGSTDESSSSSSSSSEDGDLPASYANLA